MTCERCLEVNILSDFQEPLSHGLGMTVFRSLATTTTTITTTTTTPVSSPGDPPLDFKMGWIGEFW